MTQEEKELLIKDLCARLPYNVKIKRSWIAPMTGSPEETITTFSSFDVEVLSSSIELNGADGFVTCEDGKTHTVRNYSCLPYLRPLSSMTEDEYNELKEISSYYGLAPFEDIHNWTPNCNLIDWLNVHHFDYRGLIPRGLALETTEGVYEHEAKSDVNESGSRIGVGCKIRSKENPDVILRIVSDDCHGDEFECSNGSVLSLKQIKKHYDLYIEENNGTIVIN